MRRYRKLHRLLRNFDHVKVKVRPHLENKECYEVTQHRKEVAFVVEGLRVISSANKFNVENTFTNDVSLKEFRDRFEKAKIPVVLSERHDNHTLVRLCSFFKLF